jgi:uncharacterized protein YraI
MVEGIVDNGKEQLMRRMGASLISLCALSAATTASAQDAAVITTDLNMRAGPSSRFPVITTLPADVRVEIYGCVDGYEWCDVSWRGNRGWVFADYLNYRYDGRLVPVVDYGPRIGIDVVGFSVDSYWQSHYRDRPWYDDRSRWITIWDRDGRDYRGRDRRDVRDRDWDRDRDRDRSYRDGDRDRDRDRADQDRDRDGDRDRADRDRSRDQDRDRADRDRDSDRYGYRSDDERKRSRGDRNDNNERSDQGRSREQGLTRSSDDGDRTPRGYRSGNESTEGGQRGQSGSAGGNFERSPGASGDGNPAAQGGASGQAGGGASPGGAGSEGGGSSGSP